MHAAPPVRLACNRGEVWPAFQSALHVAALVVFAVWLCLWTGSGQLVTAVALVVAAVLGRFAARGSRERAAELVWDGRVWSLSGRPGEVAVRLDLGGWLLLHFRPAAPERGARWLEVRAVDGGPSFHLWRAALHSPRAAAGAAVAVDG